MYRWTVTNLAALIDTAKFKPNMNKNTSNYPLQSFLSSKPSVNANANGASDGMSGDVRVSFSDMAQGRWQGTSKKSNQSRWQRLLSMSAYHWVISSQLMVMLIFISYLPWWLIGLGAVSALLQLPSIKYRVAGQASLKRRYYVVQLLLFVGGLAGLWVSYGGNYGVDTGVAFLLLCLIGKLWELYRKRDGYIVLNLSLFAIASLFLLDQGMFTTLLVVVCILMVMMALVAMNDDGNQDGGGRLRTLGLLSLTALPLLVVLFLFFPRLPPLWSIKLSNQQATTGMSDSMSPGDFSNLAQSTELAFRVEFDGRRPERSQMYWRGLVFSDFDGVTWKPSEQKDRSFWVSQQPEPNWVQNSLAGQSQGQYQVILEPTHQQWLFALDYPKPEPKQGLGMTSEYNLRSFIEVAQQYRYQAEYYPNAHIDTQLSEQNRQVNLALPAKGNDKSRAFAQTLLAQSGNDPVRYINAVQRHITQNNFRYTLSPPLLGKNRIDEFLFESQAGFCEHYSSSFTFLMRAAGIPARVVVGYQGGELGRDGQSWEVRQMDAHAWTEVWLAGQGWVRVDPTAFVAPNRVEQGMDAVTSQQGSSMFGDGAGASLSYQQYRMLQQMRRLSDQLSYYWQRDVVGYDQDSQKNSLLEWFNIKNLTQQLLVLIGAFALLMALVVAWLFYQRRKIWHPVDKPFILLSKQLQKRDPSLARQEQEDVLMWLERIGEYLDAQAVSDAKTQYRQLRYSQTFNGMPNHSQTQQSQQGQSQNSDAQKQLSKLKHSVKLLAKLG